jgi:signal transduction histidine kinase
MNPLMRRIRAHPLAADGLLALVLTGVSLAAYLATREDCCPAARGGRGAAFAIALILLTNLPLIWRRRSPVASGTVVGLASVAYGIAPFPDLVTKVPLGALVSLYSVVAYRSRRTGVLIGLVAAVVATVAMLVPASQTSGITWLSNALLLASAWALGDSARTRRAYTAELEDRAVRLERERELEARRAVSEERGRIARELHDVIAHHVSMMVVQAEAGPVVVERDPPLAVQAFDAIGTTGRQVLVEMRRLLGVLRDERDEHEDGRGQAGAATAGLAPQPGIVQVAALVEQVRQAGFPVELVVEGEPGPLPPGVDLSAYRIVQEALTNTMKHAGPSRARVLVRYGTDDVELQVTDDGRGLPGGDRAEPGSLPQGHGLLGMRERVNLFGGELRAGPGPGGGFTVTARLPLEAVR